MIDKSTGEVITFIRTPYNYDTDKQAKKRALTVAKTKDEQNRNSKTKQTSTP